MVPIDPAEPPLLLVHLGGPVPAYAVASSRVAVERSGRRVILLTDAESRGGLDPRVEVLPIDDWYDPEPFAGFRARSPLDPSFRAGFWHHAAERFFVLAQAAGRLGLERFLHAELDVLILDIAGLCDRLDGLGTGLFIPRDDGRRAIASLIYVNDRAALDLLCSELATDAAAGNEMRLLARFMDRFPDRALALPTDEVFVRRTPFRRRGWRRLDPSAVGGIVDAAALGQWLLGIDPRNAGGRVENRFRNERMAHDPARLRFGMDRTTGAMTCGRLGGRTWPLLALHVHSKAFDIAADPERLASVIERCNRGLGTEIVGPRSAGQR